MIEDWLDYKKQAPNSYTFKLINVTEKGFPDNDIKEYLSNEIIKSYRGIEFIKTQYQDEPEEELRKYILDYVLSSDKNQITRNVHQGDFGEILTTLIISYFEGLEVPLKKLRWKFNKDRSVFGTDLLAHNAQGPLKNLHYYEIKSRLKIRKEKDGEQTNYITIIAHNSLLKDQQVPNEAIADFLARMYFESEEFDKAARYMDVVKNPNNYDKYFELFFIIEHSKFIPEILTELEELPPALNPLKVTVVQIKNFGKLLLEIKKMAIDQAVKIVYDK